MTKYLLFLLVPMIGISQPVLTNSIVPEFGAQYDAQFIDNPVFDPGSDGANQIWDFSNLQGQFEIHFSILDPANTPETDSFPDASFVWNIVEFESFFYYSSNEDGISQMGTAVESANETTFLVINSVLEDALQFPVTFGTSYAYHTEYDNYLFGNPLSSGQRDGALTADAYGTITTPYGTYENVLRLKIVTSEFGFNETQYAWYDVNSFLPILVYEFSDAPDETPSLYYADIDEVLASKEIGDVDSPNIFFSHALNSILIQSNDPGSKIRDLQLLSMDGNLIQKDERSNVYNKTDEIEFNIRNSLVKGIYIFRYTQNEIIRSIPIFIGN